MNKQSLLLVVALSFLSIRPAGAEPGMEGMYTSVQLDVLDLQKDAKLIGLSKEVIRVKAQDYLRKHKVSVSDDGRKPAIIIKVTTVDVVPQVASYILVSMKEPAKLPRRSNAVFVTSWQQGKMITSEPTKHEAMVLKSIQDMLDAYLQETLK